MGAANFYNKFVIIILVLNNMTQASRRWNLEFHSLTCSKNASAIKTFDCNFNKVEPSHYIFSVRLIFNKNLDKEFFVRYFIDVRTHSKKNILHFIDVKLNACEAIRTSFDIPLLQTLIMELRRTSNLPFKCPFIKDFLYEIKNLSVTDKYLIMSVPNLNFTNGFELYESSKLIGSFITEGGIAAKS